MARPEKPLASDTGPVAEFADGLRRLRREAGLSYRAMAEKTGYSVAALSQAAAGERLPSLAVTLAYAEACGAAGGHAEWEARWRQSEQAVRRATAAARSQQEVDAPAPYRGLARYEPADSTLFFGRDALTADLVSLVARERVSVVVGPSGSGKSSLLRAGLIPRLQHPDLAGTAELRIAALRICTPGPRPLSTHGRLFTPSDTAAAGDAAGDTVVIIDQFEEVFTLCTDVDEREAFLDLVLAARGSGSRLRLVLGVRADFYGHCLRHAGLADVLREATLAVGPMRPEELREAITKPAAAHGLVVERALTARLIDEVSAEPGGLPLMSHVLLETWRHRTGRTLGVEAYQASGGLHGAVARTAETLYTTLEDHQAALTRKILLRLITPGESSPDTSRPVERTELDFGRPQDTTAVLEQFAHARLITLDDGHITLAHEALITAWPRLREWINEERERLRLHRQLTDAAQTWQQLGRETGELWRGPRLTTAEVTFPAVEGHDDLSVPEREFLTASLAAHTQSLQAAARSRRRTRTLLTTIAALVILALLAGTAAWQQNRESDRQRLQAAARQAADVAAGLRATDPATAQQLSVAAWRLHPSPETRAALLGALHQPERQSFVLAGLPQDTQQVVSGDGRTMMVVASGKATAWDLVRHRVAGSWRAPTYDNDSATAPLLSPDGQTLALPHADGRVRLWDIKAERYRGGALGPPVSGVLMSSVRFTADGQRLLFRTGGHLEMWDTRTASRLPLGTLADRQLETADFESLPVSPDGHLLAWCSAESSTLELWDITRDRRLNGSWDKEARCFGGNAQIAPGGRTLAVSEENGLRLWDITSGQQLPMIKNEGSTEYTFSPDGKFLLSVDHRTMRIFRRGPSLSLAFRYPRPDTSAQAPHDLRLDTRAGFLRYLTPRAGGQQVLKALDVGSALTTGSGLTGAAFSADGTALAVLRTQGRTLHYTILDTRTGHERAALPDRPATDNTLPLLTLSADGRRFARAVHTPQGSQVPERIEVWDTDTSRPGRPVRQLATLPAADRQTAFSGLLLSPDGRTVLATGGEGRIIRWEAHSGRLLHSLDYSRGPNIGEDENGQELAEVRADGQRILTRTGALLRLPDGKILPTEVGECGCVLTFSPNGRRIATASRWGQVTLWDEDLRTPLALLPAHLDDGEQLTAMAFSPDGTTLAAAGNAGTLLLWDTTTHQSLAPPLPTPGGRILALGFAPDNRTLYAAGELFPLQTYDLDPGHAARILCQRTAGPLNRNAWKKYLPHIPYHRTC